MQPGMSFSSIKVIIPYFGQWPEWINLFMQSCQFNPSIDWFFITDCGYPDIQPQNAQFLEISFTDYKALISSRLDIDFSQATAYKLCDLKPAYGFIHEEYIQAYDFFGFGDLDLIYGNLRHFLSEDILQQHQLFSTHDSRISGHFCLLRNNPQMRTAFKQIPQWRTLFENPQHLSIDESKFTKVFMPHRKHPRWLKTLYGLCNPYWRNNYFKEQFTTILSPMPWLDGTPEHPQTWIWDQGRLTNIKDAEREFIYLHFMNWKSSLWLNKSVAHRAAWESLEKLVQFDDKQPPDQWAITPGGFVSSVISK